MATIDGLDPSIGAAPTGTPDATGSPAKTPEQLRTLAAQFESMLLTQMMNAMRSSMFDDDDKDAGFAKGPLADAMYGELSLALSRAGGFGLGESILGPLMRETGENTGNPALPGSLSMPLSITAPDLSGLNLTDATSVGAAGSSGLAMALPRADTGLARTLASSRVSSQFGWRQDPLDGTLKFHKGTDVAMPIGRDVPSAKAGRVAHAGERSGYGLTVEIDHGHGLVTRYAHLSQLSVSVGDTVSEGQALAKSGATGRVTGPHLHFEVLDQGQPLELSSGLERLAAVQPAD